MQEDVGFELWFRKNNDSSRLGKNDRSVPLKARICVIDIGLGDLHTRAEFREVALYYYYGSIPRRAPPRDFNIKTDPALQNNVKTDLTSKQNIKRDLTVHHI